MRDRARGGCNDLGMGWEQMPVEDDTWAAADDDWDLVDDWSDAPDPAWPAR
jgi:hypothetical protein